jgi:hypothetical protein
MKKGTKGLTPKTLWILLVVSVLVALWPWLSMRNIDSRLVENPPHKGIVAFELAGTAEVAQKMIDAWGPELSRLMEKSIKIDFLFIPAYALLFFSATMLFSLVVGGSVGVWIKRIAFLPFVSAVCDVVENIFMILALRSAGSIPAIYPVIAKWCATVKFGLLLLVVVAWVVAIVVRLVRGKKAAA